jgi:hypothetical protein
MLVKYKYRQKKSLKPVYNCMNGLYRHHKPIDMFEDFSQNSGMREITVDIMVAAGGINLFM